MKKVLKGVQNKRPKEVQNVILRRHLLELTQSFMIPLVSGSKLLEKPIYHINV